MTARRQRVLRQLRRRLRKRRLDLERRWERRRRREGETPDQALEVDGRRYGGTPARQRFVVEEEATLGPGERLLQQPFHLGRQHGRQIGRGDQPRARERPAQARTRATTAPE